MSEEMKLLTALCNALGFDVERKVEVTKGTSKRTINRNLFFGENPFPEWKEYEFIGNGEYVEVKREVIFKVTKRESD